MRTIFTVLMFLSCAGAAPAQAIQEFIESLDGRVEVLVALPTEIERGRDYEVVVRITNFGKTPLPGLSMNRLDSGEPCLFVGWGFSRTAEEPFGFLGTYPIDAPLAAGASRELTMTVTADRSELTFFRVGLWVSRKETGGFMGGPLGNTYAREVVVPTGLRDGSRKALLFAMLVCNAFFLAYIGLDAVLKRPRGAKAAATPESSPPPPPPQG